MDFELIESNKLGGKWEEEYLIARKRTIYLRIVGDGKEYRLMTATANEGIGGYIINKNTAPLCGASARLARKHNCEEGSSKDRQGAITLGYLV